MSLRIAFFGLPLAALLLERDGHDLGLVALSRLDAVGVRRARNHFGDRLLEKPKVSSPDLHARVKALAPDLLVSWFWTTRLPMPLVRLAKHGGIGAHPSLLPRHRGPDPTYWAIASGDDVTGVSVHRIEADYDTGDVLAQETLAIDPTWTSWNLARALDRPSLRLLRATVQRIKRGETIEAHVQDAARATAAPVPSDEDCAIRWSWPTARVLRHVRALAPAPGAWTELAGELVVITRAVVATNVPSALAPGETAVVDDLAVVRTADGGVTLLEAEIEGTPCDARGLASLVARHAR